MNRKRREDAGYLKLNQPKLSFSLNPDTGLPDGFRNGLPIQNLDMKFIPIKLTLNRIFSNAFQEVLSICT